MSRSYATTQCSIWLDAQFTALSGQAQAVYHMLSTQPDIGAAGACAITRGRWAEYSAQGNPGILDAALSELTDAGFVLIDTRTEELLVTGRVLEDDGGYKHAIRRKAVLANAATIRSPRLKTAVATDLDRLGVPLGTHLAAYVVRPDNHPNGYREPPESLSSATQEPPESHPRGTGEPVESLRSVVTLRGNDPHSTLHTLEPAPLDSHRPGEHCADHPGGTREACGACARARTAAQQWDRDRRDADRDRRRSEREAAALERSQCQLCDDNGYRLTPNGPGQWCNHQPLNPGGLKRALETIKAEEASNATT